MGSTALFLVQYQGDSITCNEGADYLINIVTKTVIACRIMAPRVIRLYMANSCKKRAEEIPHEACDTVIFTE